MKTINGPKGRIYLDHSPKTVALIGMGPSFQDYLQETMTQELTPEHHDEVWGINMIGNTLRCDVVFWLDDLKSQAELKPHINIPTDALKAVLSGPHGMLMEQIGGEPLKKYIEQIMALPPVVRQATYDEFAAGFDRRTPYMANLPLGAVMAVKNAMNEDRQKNHRDETANLAGLISMLDRHKTPVITAQRRPEHVENSFDFPVDEIAHLSIPVFGKPYLNNGVAMAIAYAIWKGVKLLKIYGCDFTYPNREYAESGRACVESWIAVAHFHDMQIALPPHTSLMDMVSNHGIYGYAEQPVIEYQGREFRCGTDEKYNTVRHDEFKFIAPDTRNEDSKETIDVLSQSNTADSATRPARSKRRLRVASGAAGSVRAADAPAA